MSRLRIGTVEGLVEPPDGVTVTGPTRVFGDAALCADGRVLWYRERRLDRARERAGPALRGRRAGRAADRHRGRAPDPRRHRTGSSASRASSAPRAGTSGTRPGAARRRPGRSPAPTTTSCSRACTSAASRAPTTAVARGTRRSTSRPTSTRCARSPGRPTSCSRPRPSAAAVRTTAASTWRVMADGLHATYCRVVAIAGDAVLVSASEGPRGRTSALYRRGLESSAPFERVTDWIDGQRRHPRARRARRPGRLRDPSAGWSGSRPTRGTTWEILRDDLAPITSVSLVP